MKQFFALLFSLVLITGLMAQDHLVPLSSNPSLFHLKPQVENDKQFVAEDSIIYEYDTLSLPFIDDFTSDHLSKRIIDLQDPKLNDTTLYAYYQGGIPIADSLGFRIDTTYTIQYNVNGDSIGQVPNTFVFLQAYNLTGYPTGNPSNVFVFPPYTIRDTLGKTPDTFALAPNVQQDSITYYLARKNSNDWYTDRDVLINQTFGIRPPSVGVATFDGLNQYGLPYSPDFDQQVLADRLTSVPIDLSNTSNDTSVYFTFYYQGKGLSLNAPNVEDSLVLDFYNVDAMKWSAVWGTAGIALDTFRQVHLRVEPQFHREGFQFRFRAYAQGAGAYDHWHVDYLYLNDGRDANDTIFKDIAYVNAPQPMLENYFAMPWWHFKSNPPIYQRRRTTNNVNNLFDQGFNVYYQLNLIDSINNGSYYSQPGNNFFRILQSRDTINLNHNVAYDYVADSIQGPGKLEAVYHLDFRPGPNQEKDFILANDTLKTGICLDNYYAYDDGTAEAGYGINPPQGSNGYEAFMAQKYEIPFQDTIGGIRLYFLPQFPDIRRQTFEIMVWNNLNPGAILFKDEVKINPIYDEDNGYITYWFDSLVVVNQSFYIGFRAVGVYSLNVGYDLNNNNRDKIFWSVNGFNWNSPSASIQNGSLMMQPVFRKRNWGVGIPENKAESNPEFSLFPNPADETVQFAIEGPKPEQIQLINLQGKLIHEQSFEPSMDLREFPPGLYFVRLIGADGQAKTKKLIKSR